MIYKICSYCSISKSIEEFHKLKATKDGLNRNCKSCRKEMCDRYSKSEKGQEKKKNYTLDHAQENRDRANKYYNDNKKLALIKAREYRHKNIDIVREKTRIYNRRRRAEKRPGDLLTNLKRVKKRYRSDIKFRLKVLLSGRMKSVLKRKFLQKTNSITKYLGCSIGDFKKHIESQFDNNMNWDNYGKLHGNWHLDHKIPLCLFDLSREACRHIAFHFSNTQPLWAEKNWSKGGRYVS